MVTITINGKKREREFPNMAHALAFAYQNGECYAAEKIELAYAAAGEAAKEPVGTPICPEGTLSQSGAGVDNPNQAGKNGKPLEDLTHKELIAYAKELNINVGFFPKDADLIAAIRAKQEAAATEPGAAETPQESAGNTEVNPDGAVAEAVKEAGVDSTDQAV